MKKIFQIYLFLFLSSTVFSQTPTYNEEFQINTVTEFSFSNVASLANGGFIVCWDSPDFSGSEIDYEVYAQLFDENANKIGVEFIVNTSTYDLQKAHSVSGLTNGGFVVSWESWQQDGNGYGIFAQIFDENGLKLGNEFQVNTYTNDLQTCSDVCGLSTGGFIISWVSYGQDGSATGIYAQIYEENGTPLGEEFRVNTNTNNQQLNPEICNINNGGFVICWQSLDQDGSGWGIYAQIFDSQGVMVGNEIQVNSFTENDQLDPAICELSDGRFIICWDGGVQENNIPVIAAQLYDTHGTQIETEFRVNSDIYFGKSRPSISKLANSGFAVCWNSWNQDGNWLGVFAQLYNEEVDQVGNEFQINSHFFNDQLNPSIALFFNNRLVISWTSMNFAEDNYGVFAKYYLPDPIGHNLTSFNLLLPQTSNIINHNNPRFIWEQASEVHINFPWELTYDLYIDENLNFINPTIYEGIQDTTVLPDTLTNGKTYYWKVLARTFTGDSLWCSDVNNFYVDPNAVTGIKDINDPLPEYFILHQNYPNPFNPTTKIKFTIPANLGNEDFRSLLKVYDVLGNEITTLVDEQKPPGTYEVEFSADDFSLTSGIYFYKLTVGQFSDTRKMLLIK